MTLERFEPGEALFHQGDEGEHIYLVLQGNIECAIEKLPEDVSRDRQRIRNELTLLKSQNVLREQSEITDYIAANFSSKFKDTLVARPEFDCKMKEIFIYLDYIRTVKKDDLWMLGFSDHNIPLSKYYNKEGFLFRRVFTAKHGDVIGETSIDKNHPRSGTCYAITKATVLKLSKQDFKAHFQTEENEDQKKYNFWKSYFPKLTERSLRNLAYISKEITLSRRNFVFMEGDEADGCYLISRGRIKIYSTDLNTRCTNQINKRQAGLTKDCSKVEEDKSKQ